MRRIFAVLLLCCSFALARGGHGSGGHSSSHSSNHSSKSHSSTGKSVHVRGYTRKDGTYVASYNRRPPGTAMADSSVSGVGSRSYRPGHVAEGYQLHPTVQQGRHGRIKRSGAAKVRFEREQPCPSTGKMRGRCPGYVIDHVNPLECGGADAASNMQWQTVQAAKEKDKTERYCRL